MARLNEEAVRAQVQRLLAPETTRAFDATGNRNRQQQRLAQQQLVLSAFASSPDLVYSVGATATARCVSATDTLLASLTALRSLMRASVRLVLPPKDIGPLQQAQLAAAELAKEGEMSSAALQRFDAPTQLYLRRHLPGLYSKGLVVPAPADARLQAAQLWQTIKTGWVDLLSSLTLLSGIEQSFRQAALPSELSQRVRTRVGQDMTLLVARLAEQEPDERLGSLEQDSVQLLAMKAALKVVANLPAPRLYYVIKGPVVVSEDAAHPASLATTVSTLVAPYEINTALTLQVQTGALPARQLTLPLSAQPGFDTGRAESYTFAATVTAAAGPYTLTAFEKELELWLSYPDGRRADGSVSLPSGAGQTAATLAAAIQSAWTLLSISPSDFLADDDGGALRLRGFGGCQIAIGTGTANAPLGLTESGGYLLSAAAPASLTGTLTGTFSITAGVNDRLVFQAKNPATASWVTVSLQLAAGVQTTSFVVSAIDAALAAVGLGGLYQAQSSSNRVRIRALNDGVSYALLISTGSANATLGFTEGALSEGSDELTELTLQVNEEAPVVTVFTAGRWSARSLALELQASLGVSWRVLASGTFGQQTVSIRYVDVGSSIASILVSSSALATYLGLPVDLRSYGRPLSAQELVDRLNQLNLALTSSTVFTPAFTGQALPVGDPLRLAVGRHAGQTSSSSPSANTLQLDLASSSAQVGDRVRLEDGSYWTVTVVTSSYIRASGSFTPTPSTSVGYVVGPVLSLSEGETVVVDSTVNQGTFLVDAVVEDLVVRLRQPLALAVGSAAAVRTGTERVRLTAKDAGTCVLSGTGADLLLGGPETVLPLTSWVRLPALPEVPPSPGDAAMSHTSSPFVAEESWAVIRVEGVWLQLEGERELGTSYPVQPQPPFFRIQNHRHALLAQLEATLGAKLADSPPLTSSDQAVLQLTGTVHPTQGQLGQALQKSQALIDWLEEVQQALALYTVTPSALLSRIRKQLKDQGDDRAEDLLTSGDFVGFFALADGESSYVGTLRRGLQALARDRLPQDARFADQDSRVRVSAQEEEDPETDFEAEEGRRPGAAQESRPLIDIRDRLQDLDGKDLPKDCHHRREGSGRRPDHRGGDQGPSDRPGGAQHLSGCPAHPAPAAQRSCALRGVQGPARGGSWLATQAREHPPARTLRAAGRVAPGSSPTRGGAQAHHRRLRSGAGSVQGGYRPRAADGGGAMSTEVKPLIELSREELLARVHQIITNQILTLSELLTANEARTALQKRLLLTQELLDIVEEIAGMVEHPLPARFDAPLQRAKEIRAELDALSSKNG